MTASITGLQQRLGYVFREQRLCVQALTHRSYGSSHNERLEFLGDAVLDLLVGEALFQRYPLATEGELSHMRAQIVCGDNLARIARQLDVGSLLNLGTGEVQSGGRDRTSSLANAVEALIAAVYLDGGIERCRDVVRSLIDAEMMAVSPGVGKDAKTRLQEWLQARHAALPRYRVLERTGMDHEATFTVSCEIDSPLRQVSATASSRRKAEQLAAASMLAMLESSP